jgi:hypothetical protein
VGVDLGPGDQEESVDGEEDPVELRRRAVDLLEDERRPGDVPQHRPATEPDDEHEPDETAVPEEKTECPRRGC